MKTYEYHPLSRYFPMLPPDERKLLKKSIQEIGLLQPITICQGMILDGRNRYEICLELGIDAPCNDKGDDVDPLELVLGANMRRRHLTEGQKVQIFFDAYGPSKAVDASDAGKIGRAKQLGGSPQTTPDVSRSQVSAVTGASDATVRRVEAVQDDPEIKEQVRSGEIGATAAVRAHERKQAAKAKFPEPKPTLADMYERAPGVREMMDLLGRIINQSAKWGVSAEIGKIDPKGHTPLMIKKVDDAIYALRVFKKNLEELRNA